MKILDNKLSYSDVSILKAVAILMMLCHHFWGFPEWLASGVSIKRIVIGATDFTYQIGQFSKLCVGIFAFLNGYLFYIKRKDFQKGKYRIRKILGLLVPYWMVEIIFLGFSFAGLEPFPNLSQFLLNLIGLETGIGGGQMYALHGMCSSILC